MHVARDAARSGAFREALRTRLARGKVECHLRFEPTDVSETLAVNHTRLVALAAALGLEHPVFMGSSIGGHLALDLARYHPERFRAVISLERADYTPGSVVLPGRSKFWLSAQFKI